MPLTKSCTSITIALLISHIIFAILWINLTLMPPFAVPFRNFVLNINPIARAYYVEQLSSSAHRGLILRSAVELGIFEVLMRAREVEDEFLNTLSGELPEDFELLSENGAGLYCLPLNEINARLRKPLRSLDALKDIMEALSSMSLIDSCPMTKHVTCDSIVYYSLTRVSQIHLNSIGRGSIRQNRMEKTGRQQHQNAEDDWSGMILTANSKSVIESLLSLSEKLTATTNSKKEDDGTDGSVLSISRKQEGQLWTEFAENTREFFVEAATMAAQTLKEEFFGSSSSSSEEGKEEEIVSMDDENGEKKVVTSTLSSSSSSTALYYFDIGAGSAVISEEFCSLISVNPVFGVFPFASSDNRNSYFLVDLPEVIDHLESKKIRDTFCLDDHIKKMIPEDDKKSSPQLNLIKANATSGTNFSAIISREISKIMEEQNNHQEQHPHKKRLVTIVFSLNSFLQHFDDETCQDILRRLYLAVDEQQQLQQQIQQDDVNEEKIITYRIIFTIMELENPTKPFNAWTEWLPTGRIFSVVLRAFTNAGKVRKEDSYTSLLEKGVVETNQHQRKSPSIFKCDEMAFRKPMFPLPASISMLSCWTE